MNIFRTIDKPALKATHNALDNHQRKSRNKKTNDCYEKQSLASFSEKNVFKKITKKGPDSHLEIIKLSFVIDHKRKHGRNLITLLIHFLRKVIQALNDLLKPFLICPT